MGNALNLALYLTSYLALSALIVAGILVAHVWFAMIVFNLANLIKRND